MGAIIEGEADGLRVAKSASTFFATFPILPRSTGSDETDRASCFWQGTAFLGTTRPQSQGEHVRSLQCMPCGICDCHVKSIKLAGAIVYRDSAPWQHCISTGNHNNNDLSSHVGFQSTKPARAIVYSDEPSGNIANLREITVMISLAFLAFKAGHQIA